MFDFFFFSGLAHDYFVRSPPGDMEVRKQNLYSSRDPEITKSGARLSYLGILRQLSQDPEISTDFFPDLIVPLGTL